MGRGATIARAAKLIADAAGRALCMNTFQFHFARLVVPVVAMNHCPAHRHHAVRLPACWTFSIHNFTSIAGAAGCLRATNAPCRLMSFSITCSSNSDPSSAGRNNCREIYRTPLA